MGPLVSQLHSQATHHPVDSRRHPSRPCTVVAWSHQACSRHLQCLEAAAASGLALCRLACLALLLVQQQQARRNRSRRKVQQRQMTTMR
jgi:hypothetical protein